MAHSYRAGQVFTYLSYTDHWPQKPLKQLAHGIWLKESAAVVRLSELRTQREICTSYYYMYSHSMILLMLTVNSEELLLHTFHGRLESDSMKIHP